MNLEDVICIRHSVRSFLPKEVSDSLLEELIALAMKCPSAGAIRGYRAFITRKLGIYGAPVCIIICVDQAAYGPRYGNRGRELYSIQDSAIFGAYLQLLLVDQGLSSCWVGAFKESKVMDVLLTDLRPVAIIAIGYKA
jgi:nitroreductase